MNALSMTILLGVLVMLIVVIAFILTVKSGQYDDLDGPAYRILMDDDDPRIPGHKVKPADSVDTPNTPEGAVEEDIVVVKDAVKGAVKKVNGS